MKISRFRLFGLALSTALLPICANAAGLGGLTVLSNLGEPLKAEIGLNANQDELSTLVARIASSSEYTELGIDYSPALSAVHVSVGKRPNGTPVIILSSSQPHAAPYLDLLIQIEWSAGRLMREYTTVPNTPVFVQQPTPTKPVEPAPSAPPVQPETPVEPEKPAPVTEIVKPPVESSPPAPADTETAISNEPPPMPATEPVPPPPAEPAKPDEPKEVKADEKAPEEPKPEETTEAAPEDKSYVTKNGDNLHALARKLKVDGVSSKQMLQAIFEANKNAFVGGNKNRLKLGHKLHVPTPEELRALIKPEAPNQEEDWDSQRIKLAMQAQESSDGDGQPSDQALEGKTVAPPKKSQAPAEEKRRDIVKLSSNFKEGHAGNDRTKQIAALEDDAVAREKEIRQTEEKRKLLEQQVKNLQKLLEIKNQMLAKQTNTAKAKENIQNNLAPSRLALFSAFAALVTMLAAIWLYVRFKRRIQTPEA